MSTLAKLLMGTEGSRVPADPVPVGSPFGGGYYAGRIMIDEQVYALVIAPKALGGEYNGTLQWRTSNSNTPNTDSINDGLANTLAMIAAGASAHPAANFCNSLTINGYNDWYLPSEDELEILYRVFKPTTQANNTGGGANTSSVPPRGNYTSGDPSQTDIAEFRVGGVEAFSSSQYWSSTQMASSSSWSQRFTNGNQSDGFKTSTHRVRAVRRVAIEE